MIIADEHLEMMREHRSMPADSPSLRLFRSDFLEKFTHMPVQAVPLFWGPLALVYAIYGYLHWPESTPLIYFPLCIVAGFTAVWTLVEYIMHRFVFHWKPRARWQEKLLFLVHGIHHVQPHDKTRLVMPFSLSIPLGSALYFIITRSFQALGLIHLAYPTLVGFCLGYICYDLIHYAVHHLPARGPWMKKLKRHHMEHHFKTPDMRYGVSSTAWDHAFHTLP